MKRFILLTFLLTLSTGVYAQRTSDRQLRMSLQGSYPVGARFDVGQYLLKSYWDVYVGTVLQSEGLSSGDELKYMPIRVGGRFMYRLASTRSRSFSVYAGGGAFIGLELVDYDNSLPATVDLKLDNKNVFIFGIAANAELEWYVSKKLAIIAGANAPLTFLSNITKLKNGSVSFGGEALLGLRLTLN